MTAVALVLWLVTAAGGITMAGIWLAHGGPAQHADGIARIAPNRLGMHAALAATGLVLWIFYAVADATALGWLAFAVLPLVAGYGFLMYLTWVAGRGAEEPIASSADRRIPPVVVAAHGLVAGATVLAVLIALVI